MPTPSWWCAWTGATARRWPVWPGRGAGDYRYDDRLVLMRSFGPRAGGDPDVPDPYYGDDGDFERCLDLVEAGCRGLVEHLADRLDAPAEQ